jgi:hypothetical protein
MGIFREAVTDSDGLVDVAYLALFWVMSAVLSSILFICVMSAISYARCTPMAAQVFGVAPTQTIIPAVTCSFDPQPVGIAVGAICGGFATALIALATYMGLTRRPVPSTTRTESVHTETTT